MKLLYSLLITLGIGAISGFATSSNISGWYAALNKPAFNPPNWIFAPVWTFLYILMGISLFLVWRQPDSGMKFRAIRFFFIQLVLNFCWSFIFFYFHETGFALTEILLLWIFIFITIYLFSRLNKWAAVLLVPYLSWVSFATLLTYYIYRMNP
jgi:translocator protein